MEALDVVRKVVNKNVAEKIVVRVKRGPKGYPLFLRLRLLLYALLIEYFSTRELIKHVKKRKNVLTWLGFKTCPDRRTVDRWKESLDYELQQVITIVGNDYLQLNESEWTILDSTPIRDEDDPDATTGYNSQGSFIGFKLHMSCDEKEVPLRAVFTQAHVHDSQKAEELFAPTPCTGGDSAYDCKGLRKKRKEQGSKLITSHNPRREGKEKKKPTPKILKKVKICIEQCNGFVKSQVMKHFWTNIKGLHKKAVFALTAVLAIQALAIYNLLKWNYPSIRIQDVRI